MQHNHFQLSMHCDLDLRLIDLEINGAHPRLMGSLCMKFHEGKAIMQHKLFSVINAL